jgi:hypothetical protein
LRGVHTTKQSPVVIYQSYSGDHFAVARERVRDFNLQRLQVGKPQTAGPEGPAGLKSHNEIYARRAFTPGGRAVIQHPTLNIQFPLLLM